jgi:hypothetical protein
MSDGVTARGSGIDEDPWRLLATPRAGAAGRVTGGGTLQDCR